MPTFSGTIYISTTLDVEEAPGRDETAAARKAVEEYEKSLGVAPGTFQVDDYDLDEDEDEEDE